MAQIYQRHHVKWKLVVVQGRQSYRLSWCYPSIFRYMSIRVHQGNLESIINNPLLILTLLGIFLLIWWILSGARRESSSKLPMRQLSISVIPPHDLTVILLGHVDKVHTFFSSFSGIPWLSHPISGLPWSPIIQLTVILRHAPSTPRMSTGRTIPEQYQLHEPSRLLSSPGGRTYFFGHIQPVASPLGPWYIAIS